MGAILIMTGFNAEEQSEILTLAAAVGATVDVYFAADKPFDFCIAKTTNSAKYELARNLSKPLATLSWLRDSAREGVLLPLDGVGGGDVDGGDGGGGDGESVMARERGYRLPAFSGLCVCVTGYNQAEREVMERQVVARGGVYTADLIKGRCTHLVASNTSTSKYAHASRWEGLHIVSRAWVEACVAEERRADETRFPVTAATAAAAGAGAATDTGMTDGTASHRAAAAPAPAVGRNLMEEAEAAEADADAAVAWDFCCMLGTKVHLYQLGPPGTSAESKRATRLVRRLAAATTPSPSKATHVVVSASATPGSLRALKEHREKVVFTSWLEACALERAPAATENHAAPSHLFSGGGGGGGASMLRSVSGVNGGGGGVGGLGRGDGGISMSQEAVSQQDPHRGGGHGVGRSRFRSVADAAPSANAAATTTAAEARRRDGPASTNPLTRKALAATAAAEAAAAAAAAAAGGGGTSAFPEEADQNRPPPGQHQHQHQQHQHQHQHQHQRQALSPAATRAAAMAAVDVGYSYDPGTGTELPATAVAIPETHMHPFGAGPELGAGHALEGGDEGGFGASEPPPFDGVRIALSPLLSREEEDMAREFIASGAGIAVAMPLHQTRTCTAGGGGSDDRDRDGDERRGGHRWGQPSTAAASAAYIVCPAAPTSEERRVLNAAPEAERRRHVTCHWLEWSVQKGFAIPLKFGEGNPAYRPLHCDAPIDSMIGLNICTSLYEESVKASVYTLCRLLGSKYTDRLRRNKNTHLVLPVADGAKYKAATDWGLHVVTVEWLHACAAAGRKVDERDFAPPPPPPEEEEEEEVEVEEQGEDEMLPRPPSPPPDEIPLRGAVTVEVGASEQRQQQQQQRGFVDLERERAGSAAAPSTAVARGAGRSAIAGLGPTSAAAAAAAAVDNVGAAAGGDCRRSSAGGGGGGGAGARGGRGAPNLVGTAGTRDLLHVLQASQPVLPPEAAYNTTAAAGASALPQHSLGTAPGNRGATATTRGPRSRKPAPVVDAGGGYAALHERQSEGDAHRVGAGAGVGVGSDETTQGPVGGSRSPEDGGHWRSDDPDTDGAGVFVGARVAEAGGAPAAATAAATAHATVATAAAPATTATAAAAGAALPMVFARGTTHNTQQPQDGSQLVANLIDDVAAGMMGGGDSQLDMMHDGFDGFRVPDPVQAAAAVAAGGGATLGMSGAQDALMSPLRGNHRGGGGVGGGGSASARKRRRGASGGEPSVSGVSGGGGGGGLLFSQADVESQQLVGYAEDGPPMRSARGGNRLNGSRGAVLGGGGDFRTLGAPGAEDGGGFGGSGGGGGGSSVGAGAASGLVNTLLGAAAAGGSGGTARKGSRGLSHGGMQPGGGRAAGLQAEDWM